MKTTIAELDIQQISKPALVAVLHQLGHDAEEIADAFDSHWYSRVCETDVPQETFLNELATKLIDNPDFDWKQLVKVKSVLVPDDVAPPASGAVAESPASSDPVAAALALLRARGYAVTVFNPKELAGADARAVEERLAEYGREVIGAIATQRLNSIQLGGFDLSNLQSQGFGLLSEYVPVGNRYVDVWQRALPDSPGWEYLTVTSTGSERQALAVSQRVPDVADIGDWLANVGLLRESPALSYEWALNLNDENPCEGNFPSEALRDRAIDELFVHGELDAGDSICAFEIFPDGKQTDGEYVGHEKWIEDRGLTVPARAAVVERQVA